MLRALGKVSLGLLVTFALATACGGDDGKKSSRRDDGGAGGEAGVAVPSDGGEPPVVLPQGGQGGEGGEAPVVQTGGVGGQPLESTGGAGGQGGEPAECCQPATCNDATEMCGYFDPGCGLPGSLICNTCPAGSDCNFGLGACDDACVPEENPCDTYCGDTVDRCNNPISCPDNCGESEQVCANGQCCTGLTECFSFQCGILPDGCGGQRDCGNPCEGEDVCSNGQCCTPQTVCGERDCGVVSDGCGGTLDCSANACADGSQCLPEGRCVPNECAAQGSDCGTIPTGPETFADCGVCANGIGCVDTVCVPICLR